MGVCMYLGGTCVFVLCLITHTGELMLSCGSGHACVCACPWVCMLSCGSGYGMWVRACVCLSVRGHNVRMCALYSCEHLCIHVGCPMTSSLAPRQVPLLGANRTRAPDAMVMQVRSSAVVSILFCFGMLSAFRRPGVATKEYSRPAPMILLLLRRWLLMMLLLFAVCHRGDCCRS